MKRNNMYTQNMKPLVAALGKFKDAADNLSKEWEDFTHGVLEEGYPKSLPDFHEFAKEVEEWYREQKDLQDKHESLMKSESKKTEMKFGDYLK